MQLRSLLTPDSALMLREAPAGILGHPQLCHRTCLQRGGQSSQGSREIPVVPSLSASCLVRPGCRSEILFPGETSLPAPRGTMRKRHISLLSNKVRGAGVPAASLPWEKQQRAFSDRLSSDAILSDGQRGHQQGLWLEPCLPFTVEVTAVALVQAPVKWPWQ